MTLPQDAYRRPALQRMMAGARQGDCSHQVLLSRFVSLWYSGCCFDSESGSHRCYFLYVYGASLESHFHQDVMLGWVPHEVYLLVVGQRLVALLLTAPTVSR